MKFLDMLPTRLANIAWELLEERGKDPNVATAADLAAIPLSEWNRRRNFGRRSRDQLLLALRASGATPADAPSTAMARELEFLRARVSELELLVNTPEIVDFAKAVQLEAAHQRARWSTAHDAGKTDADWFWLIGYLAGKALHNPGPYDPPGDRQQIHEKQLHRIVTVAAAAANWHAQKLGACEMRPGLEPPAGGEHG